jgi:hypothetical protein
VPQGRVRLSRVRYQGQVKEKERERESVSVSVCVCVRERERERERERVCASPPAGWWGECSLLFKSRLLPATALHSSGFPT